MGAFRITMLGENSQNAVYEKKYKGLHQIIVHNRHLFFF